MPRSTARKSSASRSTSRGRPSKAAAARPFVKMDFEEGDEVMAKWPGTSMFFKAKVTYVREDDNEYDVQYENGTVFTIKAKDVKKSLPQSSNKSRSRSRGRSPSRKSRASPPRTPAPKSPPTQNNKNNVSRRSAAAIAAVSASLVKEAKPEPVSVRQSARIAAATRGEATSTTTASAKKSSFMAGLKEWVGCFTLSGLLSCLLTLALAVLGPFIWVSLQLLCAKNGCQLKLPFFAMFPKTLAGYWEPKAFLAVVAFHVSLRLLAFLPVGAKVRTPSGKEVRMNGFASLLAAMAVVPALIYKKVDVGFVVEDKFVFQVMISTLGLSFVVSFVRYVASTFSPPSRKSDLNPNGNTGNFVVDFINGRELNPAFFGHDLKLHVFRFSMVGLAMLNVLMMVKSVIATGEANPVVVMASAFQILYSLDAMFFEEYYFFSDDAINTGFGFSLASSYFAFPFLPTLITRFLIQNNPYLDWYYLVAIGMVNAFGYIIFRASETQRCEFAKDPNAPAFKHLETLPTAYGRKLLISGWWSLVRHPNYLGEILIQWSWVLPAVGVAGKAALAVYYLPIVTTLTLLVRCSKQNARNKRKYGTAWDTYCSRVRSNLIPKIY